MKRSYPAAPALLAGLFLAAALAACSTFGGAASAEEYFSLGMAYFDLGRFEEAEKWLNRARSANRTMTASEYNLGRIAYERGRYPEAVRHFEKVLSRDPSNVMALKAAAYTRVKTGELALAEKLYAQVLLLEPESADDGYNYALLLFVMEKYEKAEEVLAAYPFALGDNNDVLLLYARSLGAQGKIEGADRYAQWLQSNSDPLVRYEYAKLLEGGEFYARALEQYREALNSFPHDNKDPDRPTVRFTVARLLLIADAENGGGITELRTSVTEGFEDLEKLSALLEEKGIRDEDKEEVRKIIGEIEERARQKAEEEAKAEEPLELPPENLEI